MSRLKFIALVVLIAWSGCSETLAPTPTTSSGRSTITNGTLDDKLTGFSFALGSIVTIPSNNGEADFWIQAQTNNYGSIVGVYFASEQFRPTFRLMRDSSDAVSARAYFDAVAEAPDSMYTELALRVKATQVWAVKTHDNKYAKMLVLTTSAGLDTMTNSIASPSGKATFDWVYQSNGSRGF